MLRRHFLFLSAIALILEPLSGGPFSASARAADTTLAENAAPTKPAAADSTPHLALLLPLNSNAFRQPAEIVRQGFLAAAKAEPDTPPIRVYPSTGEVGDVIATYVKALSQGARVVVGPLTRNAVSVLANSELVVVPTLSLSMPDQEQLSIPPQLYLFGLSVEEEARQVADMAARDGYRRALVVAAESPLAQRMELAFAERWRAHGYTIAAQLRFAPGSDLAALRSAVPQQDVDVAFLAGTASETRAARPYLPLLPTYTTSQAFGGRPQDPRNVDLGGVRFIDMPWLLQPDHPAVMIYPRSEMPLSAEFDRLYALGIDALRLASALYHNPAPAASMTLDGVTGRLTLGRDHVFSRELVPAEFQQDSVVIIDSLP